MGVAVQVGMRVVMVVLTIVMMVMSAMAVVVVIIVVMRVIVAMTVMRMLVMMGMVAAMARVPVVIMVVMMTGVAVLVVMMVMLVVIVVMVAVPLAVAAHDEVSLRWYRGPSVQEHPFGLPTLSTCGAGGVSRARKRKVTFVPSLKLVIERVQIAVHRKYIGQSVPRRQMLPKVGAGWHFGEALRR